MSIEQRIYAEWFIKVRDEFPLWKQAIWRLLGKKMVGRSEGYEVTGHTFRGITYISKCEPHPTDDSKEE